MVFPVIISYSVESVRPLAAAQLGNRFRNVSMWIVISVDENVAVHIDGKGDSRRATPRWCGAPRAALITYTQLNAYARIIVVAFRIG